MTAILVLSLVALALSVYLAIDHYDDSEHSFCDFASHISCSKVKNSPYSEMFNVPVAVFGVLWAAVLVGLALAARAEDRASSSGRIGNNLYAAGIFYWSLLGTAFVFYLVFAEFVLRAICPFCTAIHVITIAVFGLSLRLREQQTRKPTAIETALALRWWLVLAGLVAIAITVSFNLGSDAESLRPHGVPDSFAACVTASGWRMYGLSTCSHCIEQKALFGDSFRLIVNTDCIHVDCSHMNLLGYPTWVNIDADGKELHRWTGFASLKNIQAFTNCELPEDFNDPPEQPQQPQQQQPDQQQQQQEEPNGIEQQ